MILRHYVDRPTALGDILQRSSSIIAGSTLLKFIGDNADWSAAGLDLYADTAVCDVIESYITGVGYQLQQTLHQCPPSLTRLSLLVFHNSQGRIINLHRSRGVSFLPLAESWSTLGFSGLTRNGCFLGYPGLTFCKSGLLNHVSTQSHRSFGFDVDQETTKYRLRGYIHSFKDADLPDKQQLSSIPLFRNRARSCTHRVRRFGDADTAVFVFVKKQTTEPVSDLWKTARWVLGGDRCEVAECIKADYMSYRSMLLVAESDPLSTYPICCEAFTDSDVVRTNEVSAFALLFV